MSKLPCLLCNLFTQHLALYDFRPPMAFCLDPSCRRQDRVLTEPSRHEAVLFTRDYGPIPVYTTSFYCRGCLTCYYPNYYVHTNSSLRSYHGGLPGVIQTSKKVFVEVTLCERFAMQMAMAWKSSTNCARIYNVVFDVLRAKIELPFGWNFTLKFDTDIVSDAFYLYSLLQDYEHHSTMLVLPRCAPSNTARMRGALEERNKRVAGTGQPEWNHTCDLSMKVSVSEDGSLGAL
ncbi:hypothetical protein M422DRAFT_186877 [Sphaerobolus stellatus SS14]|uniref:CxC5 like cysteine cluster associated with KDZ domain-containing protein n=1 Tax=Sphaerobolus stellatus (strain SS14) TaxID=990650 RepID=A0A0C9TLA7_SPHS4|nr:hypothetical protein M422DRAFT_186877 [Sphaerobolus stellatus SS14]